jgi:quinol monooxygenase YgiN
MLSISARIELATDDVATYIAGARKILEPTRAETGCELYAIAVDIVEPNVIWISEQWNTEKDLFAHLDTPHIVEFLAVCATVTITDMQVIRYEVSSAGPFEIPEKLNDN